MTITEILEILDVLDGYGIYVSSKRDVIDRLALQGYYLDYVPEADNDKDD